MTKAVPGLTAAAAEVSKLVDRFINLLAEGEGCQGRVQAAEARVVQMTTIALQGKPVDRLEISILQARVKQDKARRAEILAQLEAIEPEMKAQLAKIDAVTAAALRRRADIARAAKAPVGRA